MNNEYISCRAANITYFYNHTLLLFTNPASFCILSAVGPRDGNFQLIRFHLLYFVLRIVFHITCKSRFPSQYISSLSFSRYLYPIQFGVSFQYIVKCISSRHALQDQVFLNEMEISFVNLTA